MNLVNLNREDSINQVEVISSYYNKKEEHTKWEDLIELSGKTVSLRLNQIGDGINVYGKTYLKGTGWHEECEAKIKKISGYGYKNKVLRTLMRKFLAVFVTEIFPQFEVVEVDGEKKGIGESKYNKESKLLLEHIDFEILQPRYEFYEGLEKYLKADNPEQDINSIISQLTNFFEDLRIISCNVGKELSFTDKNDRDTLEKILKSLNREII